MSKTRNFDAYYLSILDDNRKKVAPEEFANMLLTTSAEDSFAVIKKPNGSIGVYKDNIIAAQQNLLLGALAFCQMSDLPEAMNSSSRKTRQLDLEDDEGLAHPAVFLFDQELSVLIFERVQTGPTAGSFCEIMSKSTRTVIDTKMMLTLDAYEKYSRMKYIKEIELSVYKGNESQLNSLKDGMLGPLITKMDKEGIKRMHVTFNSDRNEYISSSYVHNVVNMFRKNKMDVQKLKITGRESLDEKPDGVDLMIDRLKLTVTYDVARTSTSSVIKEKSHKLLDKYLEKRSDVRNIVRSAR